ncbi:hypothetical protein PENTCL1PPCAC_25296, partial [Pristionchus entomophagus]
AGVGALITAAVIAVALHSVGARTVFPMALLISGSATLLMPHMAPSGLLAILPMRLMQGSAVAAVMPMIGYISSHWAPLSEMGNFVTMLTAGIQISQIITMPLSGELCVSAGWKWSYYVHGTASLCIASAFWLVFRDSPEQHRHVSPKELALITKNGPASRKTGSKRPPVPYRAIFADPAVWAIWVAFFGNSFGYQMILQFMPTFLNKVLAIPIERTGFFAILPPIAQLGLKVVGGITNDKLTCITERSKLRLFNTLAMVGCGFFLLPLGFLTPGGASWLPIAFFTVSVASMGLITCGSIKSVTLISRQYSHFVMAIVQFVVCIGYLLVPLFVSTIAPTNSIQEWRLVFAGVCIVLLSTNAVFCYWCQAEPAEWTKPIAREDESIRVLVTPADESTPIA